MKGDGPKSARRELPAQEDVGYGAGPAVAGSAHFIPSNTMETRIVTSSRAGAHFRRTGRDRAPVFVPAPADASTGGTARIVDVSAGAVPDDREAARQRGIRLYRAGRWRKLADLAEDVDRSGWSRDDRRLRALARLLGGHAALESGRLQFARMRFESVADLASGAGVASGRIARAARVGLGWAVLADDARAALDHFRAARSHPDARDDSSIFAAAHRGAGTAYAEMECLDSAATAFRRALGRARRHDDPLQTALALAGLARTELGREASDTDRRLVRLADAAADLAGGPLARMAALRARAAGRASSAGERRRLEALEDLRKALAVALHTGSVFRQARIERDLAAVLDALERPEDAEARRSRARRLLGDDGPVI